MCIAAGIEEAEGVADAADEDRVRQIRLCFSKLPGYRKS